MVKLVLYLDEKNCFKRFFITDEIYLMQAGERLFENELYNAPAIDDEGKEYVIYWNVNHDDSIGEICDIKPI